MKKKGFTLIELLAVIIILAVIALIVTPVVLDVVENARKSSFEQSANGYYDAARYLYDELYLDRNTQDIYFTFEDGEQTSSNGNYTLQVKGETPKGGIVYLGEDGQIMVSIHNGKYCATTDASGKVSLSEDIANCASKITEVPDICYSISEGTLSYDSENEVCPQTLDVLIIPIEVNGEIVEGIEANSFRDKNIKVLILPDGLVDINSGAFRDNQLTNVIIPSSVTSIDKYAFSGNRLTSITIPEGVTTIGARAFRDNQFPDANAITIEGDSTRFDSKWTTIGFPEK